MENDKSQFVVRTSEFYLSLVICHLTEKSSPGCKGFFLAKSSRSWRSSRLRGESWAGLSPRRREAREEDAKDFSLVGIEGLEGGFRMPESRQRPIPKKLLQKGARDMLRISDSRAPGTSYGACVLHVAPEPFLGLFSERYGYQRKSRRIRSLRSRSAQSLHAPDPVAVHQLCDCIHRSGQRCIRQADHVEGHAGLRQRRDRYWCRAVLSRLFPARDSGHDHRREMERPKMDRPHHDHVGNCREPQCLGADAGAVLHRAFFSRLG